MLTRPASLSSRSSADPVARRRSRWPTLLRFVLIALAIAVFAGQGRAQDTPAAAQEAGATSRVETIPSNAWLLPFQDLRELEPITWIIVICSVVAVTLIVQAFLRVRRGVVLPEESTSQIEQLIQQKQFRELIEFTETDDSFVSRSLNPALKRAPNFAEMREALEAGVAEETAEQFRRLEYINLLANIGPLLGLLGTVIGIMDAFLEMRRAGGAAEVGSLAGGISTALGTTMMGLMLAIPCLVAYSILRNKADRLSQEGAVLSEEFLLMIKPEGRTPAARPATARPIPTAAGAVATPANQARPATAARPRPAGTPEPPPVPAQ